MTYAPELVETVERERTRQWYALAGVLVAVSLVWYGRYLFGHHLGILDWEKEQFYFQTLRDSLRSTGRPPLSFGDVPAGMDWPALQATRSYVANPETLFLSPFLPLAALPLAWFFKLYLVGSLLVAVVGTVSLTKALGWRPWAGAVLYALLFLNPWLLQHVVIGYSPWVTVCWLPLAAALVVRRRPVWAGLVASIVVWSGGMHVFVWSMMAAVVVLVALVVWRRDWARTLATAIGATLLFAGPRLVMILAASGSLTERAPAFSYSSAGDVWGMVTDTHSDPFAFPAAFGTHGTNLYDGSFVTGWWFWLLAAAALVLCWRRSQALCAAGVVVFTALGWGGLWRRLAEKFPTLGAEVYPWRFFVIGYVFAAVAVATGANRARWWVSLALLPVLWVFWWRTQFWIDSAAR